MRLRSLLTAAAVALGSIALPAVPAHADIVAPATSPEITNPLITVAPGDVSMVPVTIMATFTVSVDSTAGVLPLVVTAVHRASGTTKTGGGSLQITTPNPLGASTYTGNAVFMADASWPGGDWDLKLLPGASMIASGPWPAQELVIGTATLHKAEPDTQAPEVSGISVTTSDTSYAEGPVTVTASMTVSDASSILVQPARLTSKKTGEFYDVSPMPVFDPDVPLPIPGAPITMTWQAQWTLPVGSPDGEWAVDFGTVRDQLQNATVVPTQTFTLAEKGTIVPGQVSVSGKHVVGQTLTADSGTWAPSTVVPTLQWMRDNTAIPAATGASYVLTPEDADHEVWVSATGKRNDYNSETVTSAKKLVGRIAAPAGTVTVSGTAKTGATLTALPDRWPAGSTLSFQWLREGVAISGATAASYMAAPADAGKKLSVRVNAALAGYTIPTVTSGTVTVASAAASAGKVTVAGTAKTGAKLSAVTASWPAGAKLSFQWLLNGTAIKGATAASYTATPTDAGQKLSVRVTAALAGYTIPAVTSAQVSVAQATQKAGTVSITGAAKTGAKLGAKVGGWPAGSKPSYQWLRAGQPIKGATAASYTATPLDTGKKVSVRVSAALVGYSIPGKTSAAVTVAKATQKAGKVTVSGTAKAGKKLSSKASSFQAKAKLSFQWLRNGKAIKGATKASYTLGKADKAKKISLKVTAKLAGYTDRTVTSAAKQVAAR